MTWSRKIQLIDLKMVHSTNADCACRLCFLHSCEPTEFKYLSEVSFPCYRNNMQNPALQCSYLFSKYKFIRKQPFSRLHRNLTWFMFNCAGMLYCIGGPLNSPNECYDEANDEWMEIAPFNHPRCAARAVAYNGLIYAIGGIVNINCFIIISRLHFIKIELSLVRI